MGVALPKNEQSSSTVGLTSHTIANYIGHQTKIIIFMQCFPRNRVVGGADQIPQEVNNIIKPVI